MKNTLLSRSCCQDAFKFIELLVVIAIIAILTAILFSVFARARENARHSTYQRNLSAEHQALERVSRRFVYA